MRRTIRADYYLGKNLVKVTYGTASSRAAPNAVKHLQSNEYGANRMEVYDIDTGKLYLQARARLNGTGPLAIQITYEAPGRTAIRSETE